jgi:hypothetical protein
VTFDDAVEGPVQSVDVAGGTIVVLGQTVHVDGGTSFDNSSANCRLESLTPGTVIEVSGFRTSASEIRATRIECRAAGQEFEVTGIVRNLDTNQRRFQVADLVVDYSQAQLQDFPAGQPANGQNVEVKGTTFAGGMLTATRVQFKDASIQGNTGDRVELEGLVTRFASTADFDVSGQRVSTSGGTNFQNCGATLAVNSFVEVEGTLSAGVINASKVECKAGTNLRVTATVDSINVAGNSLTVIGIPITVSANTRFEDQSNADVSPFRLSDLRVGDFVEVRGGPGTAPNSIAAELLERDDPDNRVELRGLGANVAQPQFTILTVTVVTNGGTEYRDENDNSITAAQFFAAVANRLVKARGTFAAGQLTAEELELEGSED